MICQRGKRYCRAGVWSACEAIGQYRPEDLPIRPATVDGPTECNACRPDCALSRDYPTSADLTVDRATDVEYSATEGGIVITTASEGEAEYNTDTDGDGVPDVADDYPADPAQTGVETGFYHQLTYNGSSAIDPVDFSTTVRTADVYFLMDTTGSMGGEIANLKSGLTSGSYVTGCSGGIIGAISCTIPDAWFGVGRFDDYPFYPWGDSSYSDHVYQHVQDMSSSAAAAQAAVNTLATRYGVDWPESHTQALYSIATGLGQGAYLSARAGCGSGTWGYPCFRTGTIPIVIILTDAPYHNGPTSAYDYGSTSVSFPALPGSTTATGNTNDTGPGSAYNVGTINGLYKSYTGNTNLASIANNYGGAGCGGSGKDVVFKFTLSSAATVVMNTQGSAFDTVLDLVDSTFGSYMTCNNNYTGLGTASGLIYPNLAAGTYYVILDGNAAGDKGNYRFNIGTVASVAYGTTWAQAVSALTSHGVKVITVESSSGYDNAKSDAQALANATGSVDAAGAPFVYSIPNTGTGLSSSIVTAIQTLANYSRLNITAVARDNSSTATFDERTLVDSIAAVSYDPGRCTGITGGTQFNQCLPGTNVHFTITFLNDVVAPSTVAQVFDFNIDLIGDGTYTLMSVPIRIMVPPISTTYNPTGSYHEDYDASGHCTIPPERPDWGTLTWTADTPSTSTITFQIQTANSESELDSATPVSFTVPGSSSPQDIGALLVADGQFNYLPHLRVTSVLNASGDLLSTPTLTGFELQYTCAPAE